MASTKLYILISGLAAIFPHLHSRRLQLSRASHRDSNSSARWPTKWPWNQIDLSNRRVLGEGSFGIAARYYTTCNSAQSIVVKEVKQSRHLAMYERIENCQQAITETSVQMLMAEQDRAVRIYDLTPKDCERDTLRANQETYIMMARAGGDGSPNPSKTASIALMLDITKQLFLGLDELHTLGYLHRDIKPANLLYESDGYVQYWEDCLPGQCRFTLSDYGLACKRSCRKWGWTTTCVEKTCGTPLFLPPEISKSVLEGDRTQDHYGRGMDYWALGITLFEMWKQRLPAQLGGQGSMKSLLHYIKGLGTSDANWWRSWDVESSGASAKLFTDILSKLLIPDRFVRTTTVSNDMHALMDKVSTSSVEIAKVCVDPCARCDYRDECRVNVLFWQCVKPPRKMDVFVTVLTDTMYGTWEYTDQEGTKRSYKIYPGSTGKTMYEENGDLAELRPDDDSDWLVGEFFGFNVGKMKFKLSTTGGVGLTRYKLTGHKDFGKIVYAHLVENAPIKFTLDDQNSVGEDLRDLKVLVGKYFNMDTEQAAFYYDGVDTRIEDGQQLYDDEHLYLSPPLREAIVNGPQIGKELARAIADAQRTYFLSFPYIHVAEDIMKAWPAERWAYTRRALRSKDCEAQAKLAVTLRPLVDEAQKFFEVSAPLEAWSKLLDDLSAPLEARLEKERQRQLRVTRERCQTVGYRYCAQEVRMEMDDSVDYVKVEYTAAGESPTKLKFFNDGRILKTRGDDVAKNNAATLTAPTLPGSTMMKVTLCKNLMKSDDLFTAFGNMFVKSDSRCKAIGEPISYTLFSRGAMALPQEKITDPVQMKFEISSSPEVAFYIWDGDYQLHI